MSDIYWLNPYFDAPDPEPILRDVFVGWHTGNGIFNYLSANAVLPWADSETVDNSVLDIAYFANHSGGKFCSPIVKWVLDDDGVVPDSARNTIAKILISKYLPNWQHLWDTNIAVYNPIHNYDMNETRILRKADSEAENVNDSHTGTDTLQHGMVETTAHGRTNEETDYKFGLNTSSEDPRASDRINSTEGGQTTVTDSGSDVTTKNLSDARARNKVGAEEEEEETHRAGNIGVTTTQQMLKAERELWIWNYFDQVFSDLDRELALMFHDSCRV